MVWEELFILVELYPHYSEDSNHPPLTLKSSHDKKGDEYCQSDHIVHHQEQLQQGISANQPSWSVGGGRDKDKMLGRYMRTAYNGNWGPHKDWMKIELAQDTPSGRLRASPSMVIRKGSHCNGPFNCICILTTALNIAISITANGQQQTGCLH